MNPNTDLSNNNSDSFFNNGETRIYDFYYNEKRVWQWKAFDKIVHETMLSSEVFEILSEAWDAGKVSEVLRGITKSAGKVYGREFDPGLPCSGLSEDEPTKAVRKAQDNYTRVIGKSGVDVVEIPFLVEAVDPWIDLIVRHLKGSAQSLPVLRKAWKKFLDQTEQFCPKNQILDFKVFLDSKPALCERALEVLSISRTLDDGIDTFRIDGELYTTEECLELTSYVIACTIIKQASLSSKDNFFHFVFNACSLIPETHRNSVLQTICLYLKQPNLPLISKKDLCIISILESLPSDHQFSLGELLSYSVLGDALAVEKKQFFASLLRGCSLLPANDRNVAWEAIRSYIKKIEIDFKDENSFENLLASLLITDQYRFNEVLAILQVIGFIALTAPRAQSKCQFTMEMGHTDRLLRLTTPQGDYHFSFSWNAHNELRVLTASWKEAMHMQFKLKLLLEMLVPNLDCSAVVCENFRRTFEGQNIKNLSVSSFDLMKAINPFIVMLGYRLYFSERLLNSRPVIMDMKTYMGQCAIPLGYLPAKGERRRQFYDLLAKYSGAPVFTNYLNKLSETVDWSSLSIGKPICELICHLAKENNGFFRQAAWTLWKDFNLNNSLSEPWTSALKSLLESVTPLDKDKFTEARLLLKSHCETKKLYPMQALEVYRVLMEKDANHEDLQLQIAEDILHYYSKAPNELIRSVVVAQFLADAISPLLKPQHLPLCMEIASIVTRVCEHISDEKFSSVILRMCHLLEAKDPNKSFYFWTRIQNRFRSQKEAPDLEFVISAARRMYYATISSNIPQPDFPRLIQIIEKSQTTQVSPIELRKFRLALAEEITEQDISAASAIVQESSVENHEFNFSLRLRLFKKQLETCKSPSALEKLLQDFNFLLDLASTQQEIVRLEQLYHQFLNASCTEKLYNLIVIDRLVNQTNCIAAFGKSYDNVLRNLTRIIQRSKSPVEDESFLFRQISTSISVLARNSCHHAIGTIVDMIIILDSHKKTMDPSLQATLVTTAEWLSKGLQTNRRDQKKFFDVLLNRIPDQLKKSLLSQWIPALTSLLKTDYDESLVRLIDKARSKHILNDDTETNQLPLIETLIDQWSLHHEIPCEIAQWVDHFSRISPSEEYLVKNAPKIITWANLLISKNQASSAVILLKLVKPHTCLEHWNGVLNLYYETKEYDLWAQILLSHKDIFEDRTCITEFNSRAPVILGALLTVTKDKQAIYKRILQVISRYPIDSIQTWRQLLECIRLLGNSEVKNEVVKIVTSKNFNSALFSDDKEHGLACWETVVKFLADSDKFERSWLISTNFLKKPFLKGNKEDTPFLVALLTLFLQAPKQESEKNMRVRLKEAHNIRDCLAARSVSNLQIPDKQRPQIIQLIEQSSRCKSAELFVRGCALAEWILFDKEMLVHATSAIESLFIYANGYSSADNFKHTEVARHLKVLASKIIAHPSSFVNAYLMSRELSACKLNRDSLTVLMFAMNNQKITISPAELKKLKEQLELQMDRLISGKNIFTDFNEESTYYSDLLVCLNSKSIEILLDKLKYRMWKEIVLQHLIQLITPKQMVSKLPQNVVSMTHLFLGSYVAHLQSNKDVPINNTLLCETMKLLAIYARTSISLYRNQFSIIHEALWSYLINTNSRSFKTAPDKHADFYVEFLMGAGLAIQRLYKESSDIKAVMELHKFYKEKVFSFCKLDFLPNRTKTKLIFHFASLLMTADNSDTFDDHMSDVRSLLALAIKKKLYNNPEQSVEYHTLRVISSEGDDESLFDNTQLSDALVEDVLERSIAICFSTFSPFAMCRALEILDTHISFVSSLRFRQNIIGPILAAITVCNLDSPLITRSLSMLTLTLRELFEAERFRKLALEESQDKITTDLLVAMHQIAENTPLEGLAHTQKLLTNYLNLLDLVEIMWSDDAFLNALEFLVGQLKIHNKFLHDTSRKIIFFHFVNKLKRQFKQISEERALRLKSIKNQLLQLMQIGTKKYLLNSTEFNQIITIFGKEAAAHFLLANHIPISLTVNFAKEDQADTVKLNLPISLPAASQENNDAESEDNGDTTEELSSDEE